jgi:hypothetical protein
VSTMLGERSAWKSSFMGLSVDPGDAMALVDQPCFPDEGGAKQYAYPLKDLSYSGVPDQSF